MRWLSSLNKSKVEIVVQCDFDVDPKSSDTWFGFNRRNPMDLTNYWKRPLLLPFPYLRCLILLQNGLYGWFHSNLGCSKNSQFGRKGVESGGLMDLRNFGKSLIQPIATPQSGKSVYDIQVRTRLIDWPDRGGRCQVGAGLFAFLRCVSLE